MEAENKILEVLNSAAQPLSAGDIAQLSGFDRKVVDKAMKTLKEAAKISSPRRCYWQPA